MTMSADFTATTRNVRVSVRAFFLPDRSRPEDGEFFWAYRIRIENLGGATVQLLKRTWLITDSAGHTQRVHGDGVIGQTPTLAAGEMFEYTSGTPLGTPSGFMHGLYHMVEQASGAPFDVTIPAFSLDSPHQSGAVH
jgi:ApaG protein